MKANFESRQWKSWISMPVQSTDYTCGPCSLLAYATVLGLRWPLSELELAQALNCRSREGTELSTLGGFAQSQLGASSWGEDLWDGSQMMIAVVTERSNKGLIYSHAVLVLGVDRDAMVVWWCSLHGMIKRSPLNEFQWYSHDKKYRCWSVNFPITLTPFDVENIAKRSAPTQDYFDMKFERKRDRSRSASFANGATPSPRMYGKLKAEEFALLAVQNFITD